jgi:hypothetical protein
MANVEIKLTVNVLDILDPNKITDYDTMCRLSQSGGEDQGNGLQVDFAESTNNISLVTSSDMITWKGLASLAASQYLIDIVSVEFNSGGRILATAPLTGFWEFGRTCYAQVQKPEGVMLLEETPEILDGQQNRLIPIREGGETYTIYFNIRNESDSIVSGPYPFDPKMRVKAS